MPVIVQDAEQTAMNKQAKVPGTVRLNFWQTDANM